MEEEKKEQKNWCEEITQQVEKQLEEIATEKVNTNNVEYLYRLVDIHKDLANEIYWKEKIKMYNEGNYGNYGRGSYNEGSYNEGSYGRRGRYNEGSYGRRGVKGTGRGRYRGEEMLEEMKEIYGEYAESSNYGTYGKEGNMELIEIMSDSLMDFVEHLKKTAKSPEEKQLIQQKLKELGRM